MSYVRNRMISVAAVTLLGSAAFVGPPLLGIHRVPVPPMKTVRLDNGDWKAVLDRIIPSASTNRALGVRHDLLRDYPVDLHHFAAGLAARGPKTQAADFATEPARRAYYLNAYNALVLYGVWAHRVTASVHEVSGPIEPKAGFGFFWAQRFMLDGDESVHLYGLENDIRDWGDARIHAVLNCASKSCPRLWPEPFQAAQLEAQLDAATRRFVNDRSYVEVTPDSVHLSALFDWYRSDFEAHVKSLGKGESVLDWIRVYANPRTQAELDEARNRKLPIRYMSYDWNLNQAQTSTSTSVTQ